jgi:hypothetical protein
VLVDYSLLLLPLLGFGLLCTRGLGTAATMGLALLAAASAHIILTVLDRKVGITGSEGTRLNGGGGGEGVIW